MADHGMATHHVPFRGVELVSLEQDLVGDADLADVVQRRGELDRLRLVVLESQSVGDQPRIARHADQVVARLFVAEFAGAGKAQKGLLFALPHLARCILDHVLEQPPAVFQHQVLAAQCEQVAATRQALARVHRLGEEVGDAGIERRVAHLAIVVHRHHHDRHMLVARQRAQALHQFDAVHVRHHVIDQHQVGDVARRPDHRVHRAGEALDHHALIKAAHHLLENGATGRLVVDHHDRVLRRRQDPHLRLRHDPSPVPVARKKPTPGTPPCPARIPPR